MFKNYCTIAWRNITRHKIYTGINVLGLALGICACIVIYLITAYEFSFDKFHPGQDRIYRVVGELKQPSGEVFFVNSTLPEVAGIEKAIPGFAATAGYRFFGAGVTIPGQGKSPRTFRGRLDGSRVSASIFAGPGYFEVFKYHWLAGNAATAISQPFTVVLTESRARQYFGQLPPDKFLGKEVIYDDSLPVRVSGIVRDWTGNTDFGYTDILSVSTATHSYLKTQIPTEDWTSLSPHRSHAFVKLSPGTTAAQVDQRLDAFVRSNVHFDMPGTSLRMWLQPLGAIHFTPEFHRGDDGDDFRKPYLPTLYALMGLAVFILVIAAVNFINLSTAQSFRRAKEVGIRKVMGGKRINLVVQFLLETGILVLLAVFLSLLLVRPVLAAFRGYIPEGVAFDVLSPGTLLFLGLITIITTGLAGFYPARVLASYLPVRSLKGGIVRKGSAGVNLRKGLIVFQFTIALIFIIGAMIVRNQLNFMRNADKGFSSDAILTSYQWGSPDEKLKVLAADVRAVAGVRQVILQGNAPMGFAHAEDHFLYKRPGRKNAAGKEAGTGELVTLTVSAERGNDQFIPFYKMKMIAGRNMLPGDSLGELVINETCSKSLGFTTPAQAIGKILYATDPAHAHKACSIVGVVKDFYENSFHQAMLPVVIEHVQEREKSMAIKLDLAGKGEKDARPIIEEIRLQWRKVYPDQDFNVSFLDESITWLFDQETKTAWLVNLATLVTIFISCMGLFGLAMFSAEIRTKEIGIRKVLGATAANIATLLSKDFIGLIVLATLIASPLAWYFVNRWLADFAYREPIHWWVFPLAGLGATMIALLTVSIQSVRAALTDPLESLRTD